MSLLVIDVDLQIGDVSGVNGSMNSYTIYKQDWYFNNGDLSCIIGFINMHTLSQCNESSYFKDMYEDVENGDINGGKLVL